MEHVELAKKMEHVEICSYNQFIIERNKPQNKRHLAKA
jgi:hypothetical protein